MEATHTSLQRQLDELVQRVAGEQGDKQRGQESKILLEDAVCKAKKIPTISCAYVQIYVCCGGMCGWGEIPRRC